MAQKESILFNLTVNNKQWTTAKTTIVLNQAFYENVAITAITLLRNDLRATYFLEKQAIF